MKMHSPTSTNGTRTRQQKVVFQLCLRAFNKQCMLQGIKPTSTTHFLPVLAVYLPYFFCCISPWIHEIVSPFGRCCHFVSTNRFLVSVGRLLRDGACDARTFEIFAGVRQCWVTGRFGAALQLAMTHLRPEIASSSLRLQSANLGICGGAGLVLNTSKRAVTAETQPPFFTYIHLGLPHAEGVGHTKIHKWFGCMLWVCPALDSDMEYNLQQAAHALHKLSDVTMQRLFSQTSAAVFRSNCFFKSLLRCKKPATMQKIFKEV